MQSYLIKEINKFHNSSIPLEEYPRCVKELRNKINNFINQELLYLKSKFYKKEIDEEDYHYLIIMIEYDREKYQRLVNGI